MKIFVKAIVLATISSMAVLPQSVLANNTVNQQQAAQQLVNLLSGLRTMTANFTQTTTSASKGTKQQRSLTANMNQQLSGVMKVERPGKFFWQTHAPAKQTIVASGQTVWIYDPDLQQAVRQKLDAQVANTPALLLSGNATKIMQTYSIQQPDPKLMYYVLQPKQTDGVFQRLEMSFAANKAPVRMILKDNMGQTTDIKFSNVKLNSKIPSSTFTFTPPKGVDIIDQ